MDSPVTTACQTSERPPNPAFSRHRRQAQGNKRLTTPGGPRYASLACWSGGCPLFEPALGLPVEAGPARRQEDPLGFLVGGCGGRGRCQPQLRTAGPATADPLPYDCPEERI